MRERNYIPLPADLRTIMRFGHIYDFASAFNDRDVEEPGLYREA